MVNTLNKKALITVLTLGVIISVAAYGGQRVLAEDTTRVDSLVTRISQRFNLSQADVQAVFDSVHDERMAFWKQKLEDRLTQAVKDGVITESQKTAILTKMAENKDKGPMNHEEIKKWFSDNEIDESKLRSYLKPVGGRHMKFRN